MDGTGELFAPLISALANAFPVRVIAYPRDAPIGYAGLATWVREQLPDDDFILLAESFAGPVAAVIASERPTGMRALILCATFVRNPRPLASAWLPAVAMLSISRMWARVAAPALIGVSASRELREMFVDAVGGMDTRTLRARLRAVLEVDASASFATVNVPVLYLRATRDLLVPRSAADWIQQLNPEVRVVDIDAPHGVLQASPDRSAQAIRHFLAEVYPVA